MGADIEIYAEGFCSERPGQEKRWVNIDLWRRDTGKFPEIAAGDGGFSHIPLTDVRNSFCYFLLCGLNPKDIYGHRDMDFGYAPVAQPRGLPVDRDTLAIPMDRYQPEREPDSTFYRPSWLTLRELKASGYADPMPLRGWVKPNVYAEMLEYLAKEQIIESTFVDTDMWDAAEAQSRGYVYREWNGYICSLFACITRGLDKLRRERAIEDEEHARILFWYDV